MIKNRDNFSFETFKILEKLKGPANIFIHPFIISFDVYVIIKIIKLSCYRCMVRFIL